MSKSNWSGWGEKRFDFSAFRNADKTEYLIVGVLGIIILGAAYLATSQIMCSSTTGGGPSSLMYKCDPNGTPKGCGNEWLVDLRELQKKLPPARDPSDERLTIKIDCPKCSAKASAWQERQCPNCKKWYIPASTRARYDALLRGREGDPQGIRDFCTHCGTDIQKWYIDHQPKN